MNEVIPTTYNQSLVIFSFFIACLGSYIALNATRKLLATHKENYTYYLLIAGTALGGLGVWAMHFVGMLAMRMPLGLSYSIWETVISLLAAIGCTAWGLAIVARNPRSLKHLLGAGTMLGIGVCVMHYLGMYSMRFGGFFQWDMLLVGLSMVIAIVAATAALWLAFNTNSQSKRLAAALIMGTAVCAMHYTGMLAAQIVCTTTTPMAIPSGFGLLSVLELPMMVITFVVGMTLAIGVCLMMMPLMSQPQRTVAAANNSGVR